MFRHEFTARCARDRRARREKILKGTAKGKPILDFRYRYEEIDVEDIDTRERNRIRARAALIAALPNDVEIGLGIATGGDTAHRTYFAYLPELEAGIFMSSNNARD